MASVGRLGGHPIAQEHIDVVVLDGGEGDGNREHGDRRRVADGTQQLRDQRGGGGHIGPADVRESHDLAALGIAVRAIGRGGPAGRYGAVDLRGRGVRCRHNLRGPGARCRHDLRCSGALRRQGQRHGSQQHIARERCGKT